MRYIINLLFLVIIASSGAFLFSADVKAQSCTVIIEVETIPESSTEFPFAVTGAQTEEFTLEPFQSKKLGLSLNEAITVTQGAVDGWVLRDIDCESENDFDDGIILSPVNSSVTLTCDEPEGFAVCTFINSRTEAIPTLSQWGILILVVVLGVIGFMVIHRRKATA